MVELKTRENDASVAAFLAGISPESKRQDALRLNDMMQHVTGHKPKMWGDAIVGFARYHYKYESGREGDYLMTGFSPRKRNFSIYIIPGFGEYRALLAGLGKHKTSVSCLYINKLDDIDLAVLEQLVAKAFDRMKEIYGVA